jgi:type IV secretory pathway VirB2 component (pilin)
MEKTNLETLTEQSPKIRADIAEIEAQREAQARSDRGSCARVLLTLTVVCLGVAGTAYGQTDPWSTAAGQLSTAFTGPIAKGLSLVAIVVGGLELSFGNGSHRHMGGLIFGVGLALGAATFLSWITT